MRKYLRYIVCFPYTFVKFVLIKIFHWKSFSFYPLELFSINSQVSISRGSSIRLGKMVRAQSGVKVCAGKKGKVLIGNNTAFNHGCNVISFESGIDIGENVQFGPNVLIYDHDHDFRVPGGLQTKKYRCAPVKIGNNCWIGANTIILRGTKIGNDCIIGAGSVIKGEYKDGCVIVQKRNTFATEWSK